MEQINFKINNKLQFTQNQRHHNMHLANAAHTVMAKPTRRKDPPPQESKSQMD